MGTVREGFWQRGHIARLSGTMTMIGSYNSPAEACASARTSEPHRKMQPWVGDGKGNYVLFNANKHKDIIRAECAINASQAYNTYVVTIRTQPELELTEKDIQDIITVAATEVENRLDGEAYNRQLAAILDTMLNRIYLKKGNVRGVLEQRAQFSAISGSAKAFGSIDKVPRNLVTPRVTEQALAYLQKRASGAPSIIGGHFNYFNPNKSNPTWGPDVKAQAIRSGLIFGRDPYVHYHGTAQGEKQAPRFKLILPKR